MNTKRAIRFVSSLSVLVCAVFLLVDLAFVVIAPFVRGHYVYAAIQIIFQLLLVAMIARRKIVIYC
jgi:hypothetical protein